MKFDFAIGNPAYNESFTDDGNETYAPPVYHKFIDAACEIADKVEMVHPARFLFNAGYTPKAWNEKMLSDPHFKVLKYEEDCKKLFSNTEIKGGIAITYHDCNKNFGAIGIYTPYEELNSVKAKVEAFGEESMSKEVTSAYATHFTQKLHDDYPAAVRLMSKGHSRDLKSNVLEKLPMIFKEKKPIDGEDYAAIWGLIGGKRACRYILRSYIDAPANFKFYKVLMPAANGSGALGETLAAPFVGAPYVDGTETFITIGAFETKEEANALLKYVKTKFARAMLSILKVTQHITPEKWKYVPLQDFTESSDIDWSVPIKNIDKQLYKKYGLTNEEIEFIETHVKEME